MANKASEQFQQKLAQIEDYVRNQKLPPSLQEKVQEYFRMYDETIGDSCYFGGVALILGCRHTATAKTKTQCVLYTLNRDSLLNILEDYPATSQYMKKIAASRQRRVRHFLNPSSIKLAPEDEIDLEDSKTEFVGVAKSFLLNKKLQSKNTLYRGKSIII